MEKTPETPPETIDTAELPAGEDSNAPRNKKKEKIQLTAEMKADPISKKLILLSLTFASLAVACIGLLTYIHYQKKHAQHASAPEVEESKPINVISQPLDLIRVKLKNEQDLRVEIVVECSQREACDFIKEHPEQARDLLIPILSSVDPELFSNIENKKMIRKKLADRLNSLEMTGKVTQIHFNNLSIENP